MTLDIDLFWSFRSPYSYFATPRLIALEAEWDLKINIRPVYPIAIRQPDFFEREDPLWMGYLFTDIIRLSQYLNMPLGMLNPDPILIDPETGRADTNQPHIHRLTRLGAVAAEHYNGLALLYALSEEIWSGRDWTAPGHLQSVVGKIGFDLVALEKDIDQRTDAIDAVIADNAVALQAAGHWGVPTMAYKNEAFFGQDRIDMLIWRLQQDGLQRRTETG
jgi:2-hydroxychromene-2-carboxylate isomerase